MRRRDPPTPSPLPPPRSPRNAINLRGATLQVFVLKGDRRAGAAYVERAWRLAQPDFGCRGHAAAMGEPLRAAQVPSDALTPVAYMRRRS